MNKEEFDKRYLIDAKFHAQVFMVKEIINKFVKALCTDPGLLGRYDTYTLAVQHYDREDTLYWEPLTMSSYDDYERADMITTFLAGLDWEDRSNQPYVFD